MIAWWIGLALFALGGALGFAAAAVLASGRCGECVSPYPEAYDNGWKDAAYFYQDWSGE